MRGHLPALDHGGMDPAPIPYMIRINGHLGATVLSAFPAMAPRRHGAPGGSWPLPREPLPLETSRPGVFAAGDVHCGSVKRCAAAIGEGSMAVALVHRRLAEVGR